MIGLTGWLVGGRNEWMPKPVLVLVVELATVESRACNTVQKTLDKIPSATGGSDPDRIGSGDAGWAVRGGAVSRKDRRRPRTDREPRRIDKNILESVSPGWICRRHPTTPPRHKTRRRWLGVGIGQLLWRAVQGWRCSCSTDTTVKWCKEVSDSTSVLHFLISLYSFTACHTGSSFRFP